MNKQNFDVIIALAHEKVLIVGAEGIDPEQCGVGGSTGHYGEHCSAVFASQNNLPFTNINLIEGCDEYYSMVLNKEKLKKFIDELTVILDAMQE